MIHFIYPTVLYILLPISLILIFLMLTNKQKIDRVFDAEVLERLKTKRGGLGQKSRDIVLSIAIIMIVVALSRPVIVDDRQEYKKQYNVLLAFDISQSMFSKDIYPDRFAFAKQKVIGMLQKGGAINYGISLFNDTSYLVAPLTPNYGVLEDKLQNLEVAIEPKSADFIDMFEKSEYFFEKEGIKTIVVFSDGSSGGDFAKERAYLEEKKINLFVCMVGTKKGAPLLNMEGEPLQKQWSRLNPKIKQISTLQEAVLLQSSSDLKKIIESGLKGLDSSAMGYSYAPYKMVELFKPLLFTALLLVFISSFSLPKGAAKVWIVAVFLLAPDAKAGLFDFEKIEDAMQAYDQERYDDAIMHLHKLSPSARRDYNIANSYYKLQAYEKAIKYYHNVQTKDSELAYKKLHNLGNSYFKLQAYEKALQSYKKALSLQEDEQTRKNLTITQKMLQKQKEQKEAIQKGQRREQKKQTDMQQKSSVEQGQQTNKQSQEKKDILQRYKRYDRMLYKPKTQIIQIRE